MRFLKRYVLLVVCFACSIQAQTSGQLLEQSLDPKIPFTVTRYSSKQGLPQSQVLSIVPGQRGNLLISTSNGVAEFNGITFKQVTTDDYRANMIAKLMPHESTGQVFGEQLNGPVHLLVPATRLLKNSIATCLKDDSLFCIDSAGTIYAAHVKYLSFKKTSETHLDHVTSLLWEKAGFLIGTYSGVYRYDRQSRTTLKVLNEDVIDFKINPYNQLVYVICGRAVYKINNTVITCIVSLKHIPRIICNAIDFKNENELFVATTDGLFYYNSGQTRLYDEKSAMPSHYIQSLYYSKTENCLFVGTGDKGMLKLQFKNCISFSSKQGFKENPSLSSVIRTKSGDIVTGLIDGLMYKIDTDTVYPYCPGRELYAVIAEVNDTVYAGTWGGGIKLVANKRRVGEISSPEHLANGFVHAILRDSRKTIWIGGDGISKGTSSQNIAPFLAGKIKAGITVFYELRNKSICVGGTGGVFIIDKDGRLAKHFGRAEGLQGKEVRSFYEDKEGKLWIGIYGGGIYCYDNGKLTHINQLNNARLNEDAFCMAKDDFGYFYITSNHGLWRVKEKDLDDFYKGRLDYLIPFYYCSETGILNEEFNGGFQNNYLKTEDQFYFPSIEGVVRVTPEQPVFRKAYPKLSGILVNDTASSFDNKVFGRQTHSIQFDFESVTIINKYNVHYQYKLQQDGSEEWSPPQKNTSVSFKMLPPGNYVFCLRAIDAFNDRQPVEVKFSFGISPYFYETSWFRISAVLLFLALTVLIVIVWVRRYRGKAEEKERIKRELAELELKAVQSQMNPHFIFNSLNSIKHYLHVNDTKSADTFIDNFSVLLRDFMEYSSKNFITLKKETEMLASYLALESMRMNPPFQYTIILPEELANIQVPTLLFQAFVENAIKHGITHSSKSCTLSITFSRKDNFIFCGISDDGIGRKRSAEINRNRPYHTSKGISIVNEKIKVMKETHGLHIDMIIEDRVDGQGQALGTTVTIKIPLND